LPRKQNRAQQEKYSSPRKLASPPQKTIAHA